jgi:predicted N-acyltransferase
MPEITTKVLNQKDFLNIKDWNDLNSENFPFQAHEFLSSLVHSESIHLNTGQELYIIAAYNDEQLVGAIPCYIKYHSYGEYLFDWQWANHFQTNRIPYYPKLVAYSPFTPIIGPKILGMNDSLEIKEALLKEFTSFATRENCFSASFLFPTSEEAAFLAEQEIAPIRKRINYQYNWKNKDYKDFDDFLSALRKDKRKNIRKERKSILDQDIQIKVVPNDKLGSYSKVFYPFYLSTVDKKQAHAYLTEDFFHKMFKNMPENILLFEAQKEDETVAMSLSLKNNNEIFGRYWGCKEEYKNLHFELCYYQNIEYAIKNQLSRVQAGAQGTHKIPRGFLPEEVCSFHWFTHPQINQSIQNYILEENKQMESIHLELKNMSPFKG